MFEGQLTDNSADSKSNGIKSAFINPSQDALRSFGSLSRAPDKVTTTQSGGPIGEAVPNTPRSLGINVAVKSVLVFFHIFTMRGTSFGVRDIG
ncbi:hypothetical protein [Mesorhizobium sp. LSJC264A00]|uniref:hypothetical protein n=1 Tax=unclassified Mesorhizobium TaxID=325217 RepID=UPI0012EB57F7|nr:hypothetical protein [Mesorhizobium sp. LSJC264A00]